MFHKMMNQTKSYSELFVIVKMVCGHILALSMLMSDLLTKAPPREMFHVYDEPGQLTDK